MGGGKCVLQVVLICLASVLQKAATKDATLTLLHEEAQKMVKQCYFKLDNPTILWVVSLV